jgi:predicted regulator of Ras-like GTPase activity (Roadblock/LC7/MglB family)
MDPVEVLKGLNDVDGVVGGFVGSPDGEVLASSLPPFIGQADLGAAVTRLARIFQCTAEASVDTDAGQLRFDDYKLFTNRYDWGVLCVLAESRTNARILRMATRVAARHMPRALKPGQPEEVTPVSQRTPGRGDTLESALRDAQRALQQPLSTPLGGYGSMAPPSSSQVPPSSGSMAASGSIAPEALTMRRTRAELSRTIIYRGKRYDV